MRRTYIYTMLYFCNSALNLETVSPRTLMALENNVIFGSIYVFELVE